MKPQLLFLLLTISISDGFSQQNKNDQFFTTVYYYQNSITVLNFDGTSSRICLNGNTATVFNSDGTQSTIQKCGNISNLIAIDGTSSSVIHNGKLTSTTFNSDGSKLFINHMRDSSTCLTPRGRHIITHNFVNLRRSRSKNKIDVLIHKNWLLQKKIADAEEEFYDEEYQN